jgi:hypothetical protein
MAAAHEALSPESDRDDARFQGMIEANNEQLRGDLVPKYNEMLRIFRDKMALAEPSTLAHFGRFFEFVEMWNRSIAGTLPGAVVEAVGHSEDELQPFYRDLEEHAAQLRGELRTGGRP